MVEQALYGLTDIQKLPRLNFDVGDEEYGPVYLVPRGVWGRLQPKEVATLSHPIVKVTFTYFTGTKPCSTAVECVRTVQEIERREMLDKGLPDIPYNFLLGGDGFIYEGRGWYKKPSKADRYQECKDRTLDIAYIGDYRGICLHPLDSFKNAMSLMNQGVVKRYVVDRYKFLGVGNPEDPDPPGGIPVIPNPGEENKNIFNFINEFDKESF